MKVVICGNYGVDNLGDELILDNLKKLVNKAFPDAKIDVLGKGNLLPIGIRSALSTIIAPNRLLKPLKVIRSCDLFILGGGGLFTDEEGAQVSAFWALHGLIAHFFKKPVAVIGVSVGNIKPWNKWLVKRLFKVAKLLTFRDRRSVLMTSQLVIPSKHTADLATLYIPNVPNLKKEKNYVAVSFRNFKRNSTLMYKKIAQLCDFIVSNYRLDVRLIPLQDGGSYDHSSLNKIFEHTKHKASIYIEKFNNITHILQVLKGADFVVAMRLHAGIISALLEVPFLPISYMQKIDNFWSEFPEIKPVNVHCELDELKAKFKELIDEKDNKKGSVREVRRKLADFASDSEDYLIKGLRYVTRKA